MRPMPCISRYVCYNRRSTASQVGFDLETLMRIRLLIGSLLATAIFTSCQGTPPQLVYVVVTATPPDTTEESATEVVAEVLVTEPVAATTETVVTDTSVTEAVAATEVVAAPTLTTPVPVLLTATPPAETTADATAGPTALPPNFPTPVYAQVQVAEQLFEHGRMFWIEPIQQIWVLQITGEGRGTWASYEDTFVEGEPETDPSLVPPDGRYQPERGFGKLWRESGNLRQELGWGVTPEFGYISQYEYHAGGSVDASGQYVRGPGYHIVFSLGGELFRFNEDGTWQLGNN